MCLGGVWPNMATTKTVKRAPRKKATKKKASPVRTLKNSKPYRCTCCGREEAVPEGKFFKLSYSTVHDGNDHYAHICSDCLKLEVDRLREAYGEKYAAITTCAIMNVPFYRVLYEAVIKKKGFFDVGSYFRQLSTRQYQGDSFAITLERNELEITQKVAEQEVIEQSEAGWTVEERRAKNEVLEIMGYDPFDGYDSKVRRTLFSELLGYLDDDELLNDNYKLSQIIQIINNNQQINQYDIYISKLNPKTEIDRINEFNRFKRDLVASNDKIAKENGISVKGRGDQRAGKGTLTALMRDMRDKEIKDSEINFYKQLQSPASRWAADISMQSMLENIQLDENDVNDIIANQRKILSEVQDENDLLKEEKRVLKEEVYRASEEIRKLKNKVRDLGGFVESDDFGISQLEAGEVDG